MHSEQLRHCLQSAEFARPLLDGWVVRDHERGFRDLTDLARSVGVEGLRELCHPLARLLPRCPAPDMALNNLERFLANPAGAQLLPALLEGRARTLEILLQLLSTSDFFSDVLVSNPNFWKCCACPCARARASRNSRTSSSTKSTRRLRIQHSCECSGFIANASSYASAPTT